MSGPATPIPTARDARLMDVALAWAFAALGSTAPNPAVGCVIARQGHVLATAATARGGRPHAETRALDLAGAQARGATAYVTLEPCAHHGQTPPCALALIEAGIETVFVACRDPFSKVDGRGIALLRQGGVSVFEGLREARAQALNEGFFRTLSHAQALAVDDDRRGLVDDEIVARIGEGEAETLARAARSGLTRVRIQQMR